LEITFHRENVGEDLSFAMMTKKIEISFRGEQTGQNPTIYEIFAVQATFLPVNNHEPSQSCTTVVLHRTA